MGSVADARKDLTFNQEFAGLIEIIKGIAASQFRSLETKKEERFAKFAEAFREFFGVMDFVGIKDVFTEVMSDVTGVVIVTSDEGFMGGLNARVIHAALEKVKGGKKKIMVVGEQGATSLKDMGEAYIAFPGAVHEKRYELAVKLKDFIAEQVIKKEIGRVFVAYPRPVSSTVQTVEVAGLLPFTELFVKEDKVHDPQVKGKGVVIESSFKGIVNYLVKMWITYKLYDIFEDSKLSEFAARMMRLEESYGELAQQGKLLRYRYFKSYHELIDKGMREIFAARLLSGG